MLQRLDTAATVSSRLRILDRLSEAYYLTSPRKADSVARAGLSLAMRHAYPKGEARMHFRLAKILRRQAKYVKATMHLENAMEKLKAISTPFDTQDLNMGLFHQEMSNIYLGKIEDLKLQQKHQAQQLREAKRDAKLLNRLALGGIFCLAFFLVLLGIAHRKRKLAKLALEQKNQELRLEMHETEKIVSRLSESEAELRTAHTTKNKLLSILSHDLRGQMGGIATFSKILSEESDNFSRDQLKDFAEKLHRSSSSLFQLFENLLHWVRAQSHELEYKPEVFSLQTLFSHNLALHEMAAREKKITLSSHIEDHFLLHSDKNMLDFVLRNLLSNAVKFTYPDGMIRLEAGRDLPGQIVIRVVDTGTGIPEEIRQRLFDKDHHPTTYGTGNEKGSGLGLLLCDEFLKKMGTRLQLLTNTGRGTTFYFTLPEHQIAVSEPQTL